MSAKMILIVDDYEGVRSSLQQAFTEKGYSACAAEDGLAALQILENQKFEVMFLDLNMPGMNGIELCKEVRQRFPSASIFAITGFPNRHDFQDCQKAGFDGYFTKPLSLEALYEVAEDAFAGGRSL